MADVTLGGIGSRTDAAVVCPAGQGCARHGGEGAPLRRTRAHRRCSPDLECIYKVCNGRQDHSTHCEVFQKVNTGDRTCHKSSITGFAAMRTTYVALALLAAFVAQASVRREKHVWPGLCTTTLIMSSLMQRLQIVMEMAISRRRPLPPPLNLAGDVLLHVLLPAHRQVRTAGVRGEVTLKLPAQIPLNSAPACPGALLWV